MNKIEQLIAEHCPNGVEWKELGEVAELKRGVRITKKDLIEHGDYPVFSGGISEFGRINSFNREANTITIAQYGTAGFINFISEKFWANDVCCSILPNTKLANNKYVYYCLMNLQKYFYKIRNEKATPFSIDLKLVGCTKIPLPPLPVQEEIVRILDKFTTLSAELEAELEARRKQYEYYRDQLLTFDESMEWDKLGNVAEIGTGRHDTQDAIGDGAYIFYARGREPLKLNAYDFNEVAIITAGDGAGVGKVFHYAVGKYALHQRAYRIVPKKRLNPRFAYHYISTNFYKYVQSTSVSSSVTSLRRPMFLKFPIPIPSPDEQQRIVDILDKFDTLTTSISEGLPKEIELSKKQYEYYRDMLLAFPKN